jgi:hypothetical protein
VGEVGGSLAYKHRLVKSRRPALRVLVRQELGTVIQGGEHSSTQRFTLSSATAPIVTRHALSAVADVHTRNMHSTDRLQTNGTRSRPAHLVKG